MGQKLISMFEKKPLHPVLDLHNLYIYIYVYNEILVRSRYFKNENNDLSIFHITTH